MVRLALEMLLADDRRRFLPYPGSAKTRLGILRSSTPSNLRHDADEVGLIISRISTALFVVFVAVIIASSLPPRLLNPAWQLRFVASMVNNGTIAVVAFVLLWLATILNPGNGRLRARRDQFAALATAAAIGYLLLVPLQIYAAWQGVSSVDSTRGAQLNRANARLQQLRQAVNQSASTADLQGRLKNLNSPTLPDADLARPIAVIRPQILAGLDAAETRIRQQLAAIPPDRIWQLVQESVRVAISALAYACAYAAGAFLPAQPRSLLDAWLGVLTSPLRRRAAQQKAGGRRGPISTADYLRELSKEESPPNSGDER